MRRRTPAGKERRNLPRSRCPSESPSPAIPCYRRVRRENHTRRTILSGELRIAVEAKDEAVDQAIHAGLRAFNRALANWPERQRFNVVLRDSEGNVRGGNLASVNFDVLVLEDVFVDDTCRHHGHGAK